MGIEFSSFLLCMVCDMLLRKGTRERGRVAGQPNARRRAASTLFGFPTPDGDRGSSEAVERRAPKHRPAAPSTQRRLAACDAGYARAVEHDLAESALPLLLMLH